MKIILLVVLGLVVALIALRAARDPAGGDPGAEDDEDVEGDDGGALELEEWPEFMGEEE